MPWKPWKKNQQKIEKIIIQLKNQAGAKSWFLLFIFLPKMAAEKQIMPNKWKSDKGDQNFNADSL